MGLVTYVEVWNCVLLFSGWGGVIGPPTARFLTSKWMVVEATGWVELV